MIEKLAGPGKGGGGPHRLRSPVRVRAQRVDEERAAAARSSWLLSGPTCTRRSRSTTRLRSPSRVVSTRNLSRVRVRRWSRSSAWLSSAPSSGSRRPLRRRSSAAPSSSATACPGCGRRSTAGGCRRGGPARSPRPPSTRPRRLRSRPRRSSTRRSPRSPASRCGAAGPAGRRSDQAVRHHQVDPAAGPGGRLHSRRPPARHHPQRRRALRGDDAVRGRARHRRRPRPRPGRSPTAPPRLKAPRVDAPLGARRSPLSATWRGPRPPSTSTPTAPPAHGMSTACRPPARSCSTPTSRPRSSGWQTVFGPTGRMEEGQRLVLLDQVSDWCGDSRTKVTVKPVIGLNADLAAPAYEVPDRIREQVVLGVARVCFRGAPDRPGAATSTTSSSSTTTPKPKADHNPAPPRPTNSRRCAGSTIV